MSDKTPACYWCGRPATRIDYKNNNGVVGKITSCDECFELPRAVKLKKYKTPKDENK